MPHLDLHHKGFNTQPPEGGCLMTAISGLSFIEFQHTAARRWLPPTALDRVLGTGFNTQPPEGGCLMRIL